MKLSFLIGAAVGYVFGARAGRERYETIVATARKFSGSQTVQSTAGVLQAQADDLVGRARQEIGRLRAHSGSNANDRGNGHRPVG
jgi:hypothetical protein